MCYFWTVLQTEAAFCKKKPKKYQYLCTGVETAIVIPCDFRENNLVMIVLIDKICLTDGRRGGAEFEFLTGETHDATLTLKMSA